MRHHLKYHHYPLSITSLLVCSLLLIFLLAGCGSSMAGAGNTDGATPGVTPSPTTQQAGHPVALQSIRIFNANTGWAISADGQHLLHTTQGMAHWQNVTPPLGGQMSLSAASLTGCLDGEHAWVSGGMNNGIEAIYRTNNGGASWQKETIPDQSAGPEQIFFLNTQSGWILLGKGAAAGSEAVDVLHTSDGGATWKVISSTGYTGNQPEALPFGGDKSGIRFVNASTGWVTGFTNADQFTPLSITHDGGSTWQHQDIPLPAGSLQVSTFSPAFFTASDGILPVAIPGKLGQKAALYVTHNGGTSWNMTSALPINPVATNIASLDMAHTWIIDNTEATNSNTYIKSTLYSTSDGGQHWTQHPVQFDANVTQLTFVSPTQGWVLDEHNTLYATMNGGQTWTKVTPEIA